MMLFAVALGLGGPALGQNLLVNGGFERGDFSGWTVQYDETLASVTAGGAYAPAEGEYQAAFGTGGTVTIFSDAFATTAGKRYVVRFAVANAAGDAFLAGPSDLPVLQLNGPASFAYRMRGYVFTAGGASERIGFQAAALNGTWYLDDVRVAAFVPEPATWAMLIVGFAMVGAAARRRGLVAA